MAYCECETNLTPDDAAYQWHWRGQADYRWRIEHGAARRLQHTLHAAYWGNVESRVREYESELLSEARLAGYGANGTRDLSELELLALLQHHGAATRLLDFTTNLFIALWFASVELPEVAGIVIGVSRVKKLSAREVTGQTVEELLNASREPVLAFEPPPLSARIRAQGSLLVFGRTVDQVWGSLPWLELDQLAIVISPELKRSVREWCEKFLGYNHKTIYPDLSGFGLHHGAHQILSREALRAIDGARRLHEGEVFRVTIPVSRDVTRCAGGQTLPLAHPSSTNEPELESHAGHHDKLLALAADNALYYWCLLHVADGLPRLSVLGHTGTSPDLATYGGHMGTLWLRAAYATRTDPEYTVVAVEESDEARLIDGERNGRITLEEVERLRAMREDAVLVDRCTVRELTKDEMHTLDQTARARLCWAAMPEEQ